MVKIDVIYEGDLHTRVTHEPSGQILHTDAPVENQGLGETFSPTDLVGAALASCIATVMGIYAKRKGWDLRGMRLCVEKRMSTGSPRRIIALPVEIWIPLSLDKKDRDSLEQAARSCPVHHSLNPEIDAPFIFHWSE